MSHQLLNPFEFVANAGANPGLFGWGILYKGGAIMQGTKS